VMLDIVRTVKGVQFQSALTTSTSHTHTAKDYHMYTIKKGFLLDIYAQSFLFSDSITILTIGTSSKNPTDQSTNWLNPTQPNPTNHKKHKPPTHPYSNS